MVMFGLSTTFWPLLGWRALQGVFNGNIGASPVSLFSSLRSYELLGVSKTVLAEVRVSIAELRRR